MKNKSIIAEKILDKHLYNKFDDIDRKTFLNAMEEYKEYHLKQFAEECKGKTEIDNDTYEGEKVYFIEKSSIDQTLTDYLNKL